MISELKKSPDSGNKERIESEQANNGTPNIMIVNNMQTQEALVEGDGSAAKENLNSH